ncbi:hypothetical protein EHQ96_09250 [Leptospira levettii]|uniref:hypothetical protein n=1 Tax=Leptospira levettii TaxID=2023178 RepID=UPI001082FFE7|nr:hypothetical protein [Leptospira levettii]MCG6147770.1 hypothetical protein [Leptospira levettii]MCW7494980.1 hypothetical protein [Leptospira levettii]TGM36280.1 hypothetical protein EHQ75_14080 [Leptospira levettii]TGM69688.1 hypothetical protein EHQ96_09250 [Leptospira levettii]TGM76530.1 hypothetical protein EHR04_13510 [Leptospira levettii]
MRHYASSLHLLVVILSFITSIGCGLFYKGVPKPGEFCYVLSKPPECLFVNFEEKKLIWENVEYSLEEKLRMDYFFHKNEDLFELTVATVNRVEIKNLSRSGFNQFYMRKKEKFTDIPKGSSNDETKH